MSHFGIPLRSTSPSKLQIQAAAPSSTLSSSSSPSAEIRASTSSPNSRMAITTSEETRPTSPPGCPRCDTGKPYTNPYTGQTFCSCSFPVDLLNFPNITHFNLSHPLIYPTYPDGTSQAYFSAHPGAELNPFYPSFAGPSLDLKENFAASAKWAVSGYPPPFLSTHPYDAYGFDLNSTRRKNATRETTSMLKKWLNEHKKNPYPTKGEKIMLAIVTKMTLTQVSTWFANARRRLKKENKMTWEPRNRVEDEDNNNDDVSDERKSADPKDNMDSKDCTVSSDEGDNHPNHRLEFSERPGGLGDTGSEWSESRPETPECLYDRPPQPFPHPAFHGWNLHHPPNLRFQSSPPPSNVNNKPRIWSLVDTASKKTPGKSPYSGVLYDNIPNVPPPVYTPINVNDFRRSYFESDIPGSSREHKLKLKNCSKNFGAGFAPTETGAPGLPSMAAKIAAAQSAALDTPTPFGLAVPTSASSSSSNESASVSESLQKPVDTAQRA